MELSKEKYQELSKLFIPQGMHNTDQLYIQDGKIYKIFNSTDYIDEKERNIEFLIKNPVVHTPVIYDKIFVDNQFAGYVMDYIFNAHTFREALHLDFTNEQKISAILDVYETLRVLHSKNIFLGDIHSDNFMIDNNGCGFVIDLEEIRFPGDEFKFKQCYLVQPNNISNKINVPSKYTDNVKLMICSLSLLLNRDLEEYISPNLHSINLEQVYKEVILPFNNPSLNEYFEKLMMKQDVPYFGEYLEALEQKLIK